MSEYVRQAQAFLKRCGATFSVKYVGAEKPKWDDEVHSTFDCTITTHRGSLSVRFYQSTAHSVSLTLDELIAYQETGMFPKDKAHCIPTEYDIISSLQKYEPGSMEDWFDTYWGEIKSGAQLRDFLEQYRGCCDEFAKVRECFTDEQIDEMQEIQ